MPGLSFYDKQHIQKIAAQQAVIANIFNQFILSVSPYLHKWSDAGKNNVWIRNQRIESAVDRELLNLESMLYANISAFQKDGWERAERKMMILFPSSSKECLFPVQRKMVCSLIAYLHLKR